MIYTDRVVIWLSSVNTLCRDSAACAAVLAACGESGRNTPSFIAGRRMLARATGIPALSTLISLPQGKPAFPCTSLPSFSISHSGDLIALALIRGAEIGLDIEVNRPRPVHRIHNLASRWFSPEEQQRLRSIPNDTEVRTEFWRCWTAHEAVIKQRGDIVWQIRPEDTTAATLVEQKQALHTWYTSEYVVSLCCPNHLTVTTPRFIDWWV